jgi:hypothetical protein
VAYQNQAVSFHEQILTPTQQDVLRRVGPFARERGFYLAGGTALALWHEHRLSEDFDWFAGQLDRPEALRAEMERSRLALDNSRVERGTVIGWISGVKMSFFEYRYPLLEALTLWPEYDVDIASPRDIAAMKLSAVAQRGSRKDFVDIYELLRQGGSLDAMMADYQAKFATDPFPVLKGLAYFDDAERELMPHMLDPIEWTAVKSELTRAVREILR